MGTVKFIRNSSEGNGEKFRTSLKERRISRRLCLYSLTNRRKEVNAPGKKSSSGGILNN